MTSKQPQEPAGQAPATPDDPHPRPTGVSTDAPTEGADDVPGPQPGSPEG